MMIVLGLMFVTSCKDDEKPNSKFSFAQQEFEVMEDDGTVEITINIDRAVSETVVLSYTLEGTATEFKATTGGDFEISPEGGTITVAPGATQAVVEIELLPDQNFEVDFDQGIAYETIILTLTDVVSGPGEIVAGEGTQVTVNVYEDDMVVILDWDAGDGSPGDVDMDLLVWFNDPNDNPDAGFELIGGSASENNPEGLVFFSHLVDADYGLSYVYYAGTADPVDFTVDFINFGGTINGADAEHTSNATYGLVNINNTWDQTGEAIIVQTMKKAGRNYTDLTEITVPDSGSRSRMIIGNLGGIKRADLNSGHSSFPVQRITLPQQFVKTWRGH
jgi:hypothetical protein